jgi:hypothetical protein
MKRAAEVLDSLRPAVEVRGAHADASPPPGQSAKMAVDANSGGDGVRGGVRDRWVHSSC